MMMIGSALALPVSGQDEVEFEIDRSHYVENVVPILGKPGLLEANLYGELYYGWTCRIPGSPAHNPNAMTQERLVAFQQSGTLCWGAVRVVEEKAEIQFEATDGVRHVLTGTCPEEGRLALRSGNGVGWQFRRTYAGQSLLWIGTSEESSPRSVLLYRPIDEHYYRGYEDMRGLAPEAFLWEYNEWGHPFHEARFPEIYQTEVDAEVSAIDTEGELVTRVEFRLKDGMSRALTLSPPRPTNRVPFARGYPVTLLFDEGEVARVYVELNPIAWRKRGASTLELKLFAPEQADITWNDFGDPVIPPGRLESLTKIDLVPDFAILADFIVATWFIEEDMITWGIGDRGAGMLELESLSLDSGPTASPEAEVIGPWHPIREPLDFVTNQLRIVNMSTTTMFDSYLPGNPPP